MPDIGSEPVAVDATQQTLNEKAAIRVPIAETAGDLHSIVGVIADNVGLLLEGIGRFMATVQAGGDVAAAAQPLANDLAPLLVAIDDNTIKLTHHVKGTATVVDDAGRCANAVAVVLEENQSG